MQRNNYVGLASNYCKEIAVLHVATLLLMVYRINADVIPPLRLVDGSSSSEGRLEILFNNTWGTVCDDFFTASYEGAVACRQLNFTGIISREFFGEGSGPIWLDDVHCMGNETSLIQCLHKRVTNCRHSEDVGVVCNTNNPEEEGAIQLVNGNQSSEGRVEIFYDGEWGTVCNLNWGIEDATVVCRQLGFTGAISTPEGPAYEQGVGLVWMSNVTCTGSEERLDRCHHNGWKTNHIMCPHFRDANVICDGIRTTIPAADVIPPLRLVDGSSSSEGRLEILFDNAWGTVCDDFFRASYEGAVACRQLNFTGIISRAFFGEGSGPIWLDDVHCMGNETSLIQCLHKRVTNCRHSEDVGVVCNTSSVSQSSAIPTQIYVTNVMVTISVCLATSACDLMYWFT